MTTLGAPLIALDVVDSTNAHLRRLAAEGAPVGTVVTAREQTAGYGQRGRSWVSGPDRGLYMSILLPSPLAGRSPTHLPFALGLGCVAGLATYTDRVRLKWVNDLVADRRKLGGMLIELVREGAIAGIGVNLLAQDVPDATSLEALTSLRPQPSDVSDVLLAGIASQMALYQAQGFPGIAAAWERLSVTVGQRVRVLDSDPVLEGVAQGLGPLGELRVRTDDGRETLVVSGTVRGADGSYC